MLRLTIKAIALLSLSACSIGLELDRTPHQNYLLEEFSVAKSATQVDRVLLVSSSGGSRLLQSRKILFSDSPYARNSYQYGFWAESPTDQFSSLLEEAFSQTKFFRAVAATDSGAVGDYQLNTEIKDFYHDTSSSPGVARAGVSAELIVLPSREIIARRTFSREIELEEYSALGAVKALSRAAANLGVVITDWVQSQVEIREKTAG